MKIEAQKLIQTLDLTLLDKQAQPEQLVALSQSALQHPVAAVCVYPEHFHLLSDQLSCHKAVVVNFPSGTHKLDETLQSITKLNSAVDEIDYVFPYQAYLNGEEEKALNAAESVINKAHTLNLTIKVILESECFCSQSQLKRLCEQLIEKGADFLKTSTGTLPIGATPNAAKTILEAIKQSAKPCGIKLSGGIRTPEQAQTYLSMAEEALGKPANANWFRIGSSRLLTALK